MNETNVCRGDDKLESIGKIFPDAVMALGIQGAFKRQNILFHWRDIVGADIAKQSRPLEIERDILVLAVENSVWLHHLSMLKPELVRQVNQFAGEIIVRDIRFRNQKTTTAETAEEVSGYDQGKALRQVRLSEIEINAIHKFFAPVSEDLRERVTRLYQKEIKLRKLRMREGWHTCETCGALCPKEERYCSVCSANARAECKAEIRSILAEVPWATYGEIRAHVECSADEYIDAKTTLLAVLGERVQHGIGGEFEEKRLTMLFKGVRPDALNEALVLETLRKFRKKKYEERIGALAAKTVRKHKINFV